VFADSVIFSHIMILSSNLRETQKKSYFGPQNVKNYMRKKILKNKYFYCKKKKLVLFSVLKIEVLKNIPLFLSLTYRCITSREFINFKIYIFLLEVNLISINPAIPKI